MGQTKMHDSQRQQGAKKPNSKNQKTGSFQSKPNSARCPSLRTKESDDHIRRVIASHIDGADYTTPT